MDSLSEYFPLLLNPYAVNGTIGTSPIGGHKVVDKNHHMMFVVHGITATLCLVYFAVLYNLNKTKENQWYHKWIGRTMIIPLIIATATGFGLLYYVRDGAVHDIRLARTTINSQGLTGVVAGLNAFVFQRYIKGAWFSNILLVLHLCTLYLGIKSLYWCLFTAMNWHSSDYVPEMKYRVTALEFLVCIAIPVVLADATFVAMHWTMSRYPAMLKTMYWKDFHELSVMSVMYFIGVGFFFSFSHDKKWIFNHIRPTGLNLYERAPILLSPLVYIALYKMDRITVPVMRVLNWPSKFGQCGSANTTEKKTE